MPTLTNSIFGQPPQAIPTYQKDEEWKRANLDWMEGYFKAELPLKNKRLGKNYNLVQGVIDVGDYVKLDNDYAPVYEQMEQNLESSLFQDEQVLEDDLYFFPIVPSIINVLMGELMKKADHIKVKAVDSYSQNEAREFKKNMVVQYLQQKAQGKIAQQLQAQGIEPNSPEYQQQLEQGTQQAMSLPQIEKFMRREYRSNYEEWANKILEQATHKYSLPEREPEIFKHQLASDEAYWEIKINGDEISTPIWNPMETICLKSAHYKYTTDADVIGRQYYATVANVVATYKNKLDHRIIEKSNSATEITPSFADRRIVPDDNRSDWQQERKLLAFKYMMGGQELDSTSKVLVTEGYWMGQRRLTILKAVYNGEIVQKIVDDTFKQTIKPVYDEFNTLIAGEELEYIYTSQTWQGTKLDFSSAGSSTWLRDENEYLKESIFKKKEKKKSKKDKIEEDIERGVFYVDIQPVEYQYSDSINPFRPKIPVVGCDGFEPTMNVGKLSLVDKVKAPQIMFNAALNQMYSFMKTEIGLFFMLDQKLIPSKSIDGGWGKNNWMKFLGIAQEIGLGIVDNSIVNTEGQQVYNQPTVVNLLKSDQFKSRVEIAMFAKNLLFEMIGITPQRLGTITASETATGTQQAVNNSYAQTEIYFQNHTNLMKEFKGMLLDAEKYIESRKPTSRVDYLNSDVENIMFDLDTDSLLLRRYNIFLTSSADSGRVLEQMRQLAIQNNTSGASILDLFTIVESNNTRTIKDTLEQSVANLQKQEEQKRQHEQQLQQQQLQAAAEETEKARAFEAEQNDLDRKADMYVAEVKSLSFNENNDLNANSIADSLEVERINLEVGKNYQAILDGQSERQFKKQESQSKAELERQKLETKKAELASKEKMNREKLKVDLANQKNDYAISVQNAKGRNKSK